MPHPVLLRAVAEAEEPFLLPAKLLDLHGGLGHLGKVTLQPDERLLANEPCVVADAQQFLAQQFR